MNTGLAIFLAVILLVLLVLCAWLWWRRRPATRTAPRDTVLQLQPGVFARALRTLHPRDADYRYDKPCVLVCGGAASGKTGLLRAAGLEAVPAGEGVDSGWWRSPEGLAFELPSSAWEADGGSWTAFLRLIEGHRSERALDAIVWTIPYTQAAQDAVDGERMYRKLGELQDRLGLSLPVYVVVTQCEAAVGFAEWAAMLPAGAHAQTLGWSNPLTPGTPWRRELGETAVGTLVQRLRRLVAALAARRDPGEHGAAIFLMPERIAAALAGLPAALGAAMRPNAVLTPFALRGIYLSGYALAQARAVAAPADPFSAPPPAPPAGIPLFCRDLFAGRVFGEFGLAQPVARRVAADRRARRIVLAASALVAAAWSIALVPTWFSLEQQLQTMRTPLLGMHKAILDARRDIRIDERATIELLSAIDRVPDWDTRRAALPASWFACCGGLERDIHAAFRGYYERVLFKSLDEALDERAAHLTATVPATAGSTALFGAPERMEEFSAMREFVDATLEFEYQHARFETLAGVRGGSWQDATALFSYLFGLQLHPGTTRSVALFDRAVRDSSLAAAPGEGRHDNARFRNHLRVLHRAWLERLFGATELAALQRDLVRGVRALAANPTAEGAELAGLQADIGKLRTLLSRTDVAWMADGRLAQGEAYQALHGRIRKSRLLGANLAAQLSDETVARQGVFRNSVDADSSGAMPVLAYAEGKQLLVNEDLAGLEEALGRLLQHPFAQGTAGAEPALPDSSLPWSWDPARLQAARAAAADLVAYEAAELAKAPPAYQEALRRLARSQAASLVGRELGAAVLPAQCDARWRCANFDDARGQLVPLLAELRKLELVALAERWRALLDHQAAALLRSTAAAADAGKLYLPEPGAAAGWDGSRGGALAAYGLEGPGELPDYLESQLNILAELAAASKGARAWLAQDGGGAATGAGVLLAEWAGIDAELARRAAKTPGGTLQKLETWMGTDVTELDSVNCAARLSRGSGGDYFGRRIARAAATFRPRCLALQAALARAGYETIAGHFDQHLLGRYPFAAGLDAAPADPDQVRQLLQLLERHLPGTRGPLARQKDARSSAAVAFLDRLEATRPLLGAMLAEDPAGGVAALDLWPQFRLNRAREKGADQIIEWALEAGDVLAPPPAGGAPGVAWRVGQPITLRLRWAKNSETSPAGDPARPAMQVAGRSASWHYDDPWALLRLLREHAAPLSELGEREARQGAMLRFAVPTRDAAGAPGDAVAYARLAVARHGKAESLTPPVFPSSAAPPLPAYFSEKGSAP